jgi:hypothetical protein
MCEMKMKVMARSLTLKIRWIDGVNIFARARICCMCTREVKFIDNV